MKEESIESKDRGKNMDESMISVIIPVYKAEAYLDECIQSVVDQTYSNLDIILVDDGSPDRCPQICDAWAEKDARIRVIHKPNGGAASARNAGLNIADGEYIGFVDSDDIIAANMYECLLHALELCSVGIADCGICHISEDGEPLDNGCKYPNKELNVEQALDAFFTMQIDTSFCCKLFDRSVLTNCRFLEGESNEEFPLIVPCVVAANGIVHLGDAKYFYRRRSGSVTNNRISDTKVLYKNLRLMEVQLKNYAIQAQNFGFFMAQYSYFRCLKLEKQFHLLTKENKTDYCMYRSIMWGNLITYMFSPHSRLKDKILYILILTKLIRPLYKVFYRKHL